MGYGWYILLFILAFLFLGLGTFIHFVEVPKSCAFGCAAAPSYMNGPDCISVNEVYLDGTIPSPTPIPYLGNFEYSAGAGSAFCLPVWYAFRYVRNSDGGYSALSPWTGQSSVGGSIAFPLAIYAGATTLPTVPNQTIPSACNLNQPTIILNQPLDFDVNYGAADGYTLNVHRQVGYMSNGAAAGFNPTSEGTVVGSFVVSPASTFFIDAVFNPNSGGGTCC
jgi:hypothetical protein